MKTKYGGRCRAIKALDRGWIHCITKEDNHAEYHITDIKLDSATDELEQKVMNTAIRRMNDK